MSKTPYGQFIDNIAVSGNDSIVLPAANKRRSITVFQTFSTTCTISFGRAVTYKNGIVMLTGTQPITFVRDSSCTYGIEVGSLIDQELHVIAGGAANLCIIVTYENEGGIM